MSDPAPRAEMPVFKQRLIRFIDRNYAKLNVWMYRKTDGKWGGRFQGKADVVLITMTGRRSGREITTPVIHIPHGDGILMVASQGGLAKNPLWYGNIMAHPRITVQFRATKRAMIARQVSEEEKKELWPVICEVFPDYDLFQNRTARNIPVLECTPCDPAGKTSGDA